MKKDYTHVTIVLDRSGSMGSVKNDTIGGFNSFVEKQKKEPGELSVSLWQFDHEYQEMYRTVPINKVESLTEETYVPRGMTALLDAVGRAINETGNDLRNLKEEDRPSKVLFVVITDGHENQSREFTREKVRDMIAHQTNVYSWEFVYLGADEKAFDEAQSVGLSRGSVIDYTSKKLFGNLTPGQYVVNAFDALGSGMACYRNSEQVTNGAFFSSVGLTEETQPQS